VIEMGSGYRIKHVFNYMLKGSRPHMGKVNLARLAIMEDDDNDLHVVLLYPRDGVETPDPTAYLNAHLPGMATCG
jgi:hypothetical protein